MKGDPLSTVADAFAASHPTQPSIVDSFVRIHGDEAWFGVQGVVGAFRVALRVSGARIHGDLGPVPLQAPAAV